MGEDAGVSVTTWPRWVPWAIGLVLGLVVMGPALAPGVLLNLDLVVTEVAPVPRGVWGLGPELPRRVPLYLPAAWLSPILPATITIKAMMVATVAIGFAGGYRRTESQGRLAAVGAGALIAASPLLLTRLAIGHLMIALTMALLVWAYPTLLRPGRDLPRTALWCAAFACTGNVGGLVALAVVVAGLVATRGERGAKVLGLWLSTQLVWLVPGIAVFAQGAGLLDATVFATRAPGLDGYLRVLAGHGFWQDYYQVGSGQPWPAAVVGLVLACLAVLGRRGLPAEWRRPAQWLAVAGLVTAVASTTPFVEDLWAAFTRNPLGANLRESQRALPLFAVWAALTAPIGAARLCRSAARHGGALADAAGHAALALPLACAVVLGAPGLWGIGGQLCAIDLPDDWRAARATVDAEPGTVALLPFDGYMDLRFCGTRLHTLNPWPIYLGGDVLVASDLGLGAEPDGTPERADPREPVMAEIARAAEEDGVAPSSRLAALGVRWVVFTRTGTFLDLQHTLESDPGLERVTVGKDVFTYRVRDWVGPAVAADDAARAAPIDPVVEPLALGVADGATVWHRPGAAGWLRGLTPAETTAEGLLEVPAGTGPVWYGPTALVLVGDGVAVGVTAWAARDLWRRRRQPDAR